MRQVTGSMANVVKGMDQAMKAMDLEKVCQDADNFWQAHGSTLAESIPFFPRKHFTYDATQETRLTLHTVDFRSDG